MASQDKKNNKRYNAMITLTEISIIELIILFVAIVIASIASNIFTFVDIFDMVSIFSTITLITIFVMAIVSFGEGSNLISAAFAIIWAILNIALSVAGWFAGKPYSVMLLVSLILLIAFCLVIIIGGPKPNAKGD